MYAKNRNYWSLYVISATRLYPLYAVCIMHFSQQDKLHCKNNDAPAHPLKKQEHCLRLFSLRAAVHIQIILNLHF